MSKVMKAILIIVLVIVMIVNYVASKFWIFKDKH